MYQPKSFGQLSAPEMCMTEMCDPMGGTQAPIKMQLWCSQDLSNGGLVYTLVFFASIQSSKAASYRSSRPLYVCPLYSITTDLEEASICCLDEQVLSQPSSRCPTSE